MGPELRFLILGSIVTLLVGATRTDGGGNKLEALTLIATLFIICFIDSVTSKKCEDDIQKLTDKLQNQQIKVFRNGKKEEINGQELVVGDVYVIEPGMMVPADSILIERVDN